MCFVCRLYNGWSVGTILVLICTHCKLLAHSGPLAPNSPNYDKVVGLFSNAMYRCQKCVWMSYSYLGIA